jgi:hypothetical protein
MEFATMIAFALQKGEIYLFIGLFIGFGVYEL